VKIKFDMKLEYTYFYAYNSKISQFIHTICPVLPKMSKEVVTICTFTEVTFFSWAWHLSWSFITHEAHIHTGNFGVHMSPAMQLPLFHRRYLRKT